MISVFLTMARCSELFLTEFKLGEDLLPRARYEEADVVIANEGTFPLGTIILANIWVGMPTSQSLELRVKFR